MTDTGIDVIATRISGSIGDWGKVREIVPLFRRHGRDDVSLFVVEDHAAARAAARERVERGTRVLISAGGSGTFNSVLEGCLDSGIGTRELKLGFLRKGSADLLGKVLGMPDDIESAIAVFANSLERGCTVPCDVIRAESGGEESPPRHFVGYGGAEIFGRIPHFTENRLVKYYKGVLGQFFGDLGPFFVGAMLSALENAIIPGAARKRTWRIAIDGREVASGRYRALILANGDLGPDLPWARLVPLGSDDFHLFAIRDRGILRLPAQFRRAWKGSIAGETERWGFESHRVTGTLRLAPNGHAPFPVNVDGATMICSRWADFRIADRVHLISRD